MLPLELKLYQLIISRLDGNRIHEQAYQKSLFSLVRKGIGGFIVFGGGRDVIPAFIDRLQAATETPLFIASDIERGVGQQLEGYTNFPCQMAVRAAVDRDNPGDMALLRDAVRAVALEAIDAGINMPLIPVLDVNSNPDNPIICTRAFSDNTDDVSFFGAEYIRVLEGMGLISCAKHFPGHGDTSTDSHISLPLITKSYDELQHTEIKPFREAVSTGVSNIMIGHLLIPAIDNLLPASLSQKVITDILRRELGFTGLVMTDALNMSAITGIENIAARCINAGVDIILHPTDADSTVRELGEAVKTGLISEEKIDAVVGRILKAKSRLSQIRRVEVDYEKNSDLSATVREMSLTVVKKKEGVLPIKDVNKIQIFIAGGNRLCEQSLWTTQFSNVHSLIPFSAVGWAMPTKEAGDGGHCPSYTGFTSDTVIIAIFSEVAAWRGSAGIDDKEIEQITGLIRKSRTSIVISFGSPYILGHFRDADVLIAAYEANVQAQEAVIRCLRGEAHFKGRLPVRF